MNVKTLGYWLGSSARKRPPTGIVVHATAGTSGLSSIAWLKHLLEDGDPKNDASYNLVIDRDGTVFKCVPLTRKAWHAGVSFGWEGANCNDYTVGIAFANLNDGKEAPTQAQLDALAELVSDVRKQFPSIAYLTTHYGVSWDRKSDPKLFDLDAFARRVGLRAYVKPGAPRVTR